MLREGLAGAQAYQANAAGRECGASVAARCRNCAAQEHATQSAFSADRLSEPCTCLATDGCSAVDRRFRRGSRRSSTSRTHGAVPAVAGGLREDIKDSLAVTASDSARLHEVASGNPNVLKEAAAERVINGRTPTGPGSKVWRDSVRAATPVQHSDGKADGKDVGRPRPITY
jgi:hypothetical protein